MFSGQASGCGCCKCFCSNFWLLFSFMAVVPSHIFTFLLLLLMIVVVLLLSLLHLAFICILHLKIKQPSFSWFPAHVTRASRMGKSRQLHARALKEKPRDVAIPGGHVLRQRFEKGRWEFLSSHSSSVAVQFFRYCLKMRANWSRPARLCAKCFAIRSDKAVGAPHWGLSAAACELEIT